MENDSESKSGGGLDLNRALVYAALGVGEHDRWRMIRRT